MKTYRLLAGTLLLGAVVAQDPARSEPPAPSAAQRMQELQEQQQQAVKAWRASVKKAQEAKGETVRAVRMRPDYGHVAEKALAYAREFAGTDDAVDFLVMVLNLDQQRARPALETLIRDHLDSPKMAKVGSMIPYFDRLVSKEFAQEATAKLTKSKSVDVRGWATLAMYSEIIASSDRDGHAYKAARAKLMAAAGEVTDRSLAAQITGAIDEREKFGVGCRAPDIQGVDLDGVAFKLSDYEGKVIFLDFWGDW